MTELQNIILQEDAVILTSPKAPWTPIKAKRNENGEVNVEVLSPGKVFYEKNLCGEIEWKLMDASVLDYWKIYLLIIIGSAILSTFTHTLAYVIPIMVFLWDLGDVFEGYKYVSCIASIKEYALKSEYKAYWQMNTAVNKTINAYNKLGRVPTIEEAKKASSFRKDSRITRIFGRFFFITISYILLSMTPIYADTSLLKATLVYMGIISFNCIVALVAKKTLGKFGEIFFLRKTTDADLKVVIEAVRKVEEIEQNLEAFKSQNKERELNYFKVWTM